MTEKLLHSKGQISSWNLPFKQVLLLGLVSLGSVLGYLLYAQRAYGLGFPLDDAWIHQTYARNLALSGDWAFIPGVPSGGSTSPLWSALLSIGHLFGIDPLFWAYFLGWICLWLVATLGELIFRQIVVPSMKSNLPFMGLFLALEWHLVWSAVSGMETILSIAAILGCFYLLCIRPSSLQWLAVGVLAGMSVWIRPDCITLLGPAFFVLVFKPETYRKKLVNGVWLVVGLMLILLPYILFNLKIAGAILPNTFFAKQVEYGVHREIPFLNRLLSFLALPLIGAGVTLLPGLFVTIQESIKKRNWVMISALLWFFGYLLLFVVRLPVYHQHGRYLIPAMPVFFLLCFVGVIRLFEWLEKRRGILKALTLGWLSVIVIILVSFWVKGGEAYANDTGVINTEMVTTAEWLKENTEEDALIAAHDIGALGYFSDRNLLDLAGLISPEVIPIIRDEDALDRYLTDQGTDYLVTFPDWYLHLTDGLEIFYVTDGEATKSFNGENMVVYKWKTR